MKKVLAFLLTAILAVTALTAAAAPSPEKLSGVIVSVSAKDNAGKSVSVKINLPKAEESVFDDALTALKQEAGNDVKIVDQKQIVVEGDASEAAPVTVELSVPGVKASSKVYVLLKNSAGKVVKLAATVTEGKVTVKLTESGEFDFVLVTDAQTVTSITEAQGTTSTTEGSKEETKSPQTSDNATPVMVALFAVAALAGIVSVKKIRTAE